MKRAVFFILAVVLTCVASHIAGRVQGSRTGRQEGYIKGFAAGWDAPHPADTVTRRDTLYILAPAPVAIRPAAPALVQVRDTIRIVDTLWMALPTERKTYEGEDYRAVVSGWSPRLEEIAVYPRTVTITQQAPAPSRKGAALGFGVAAGPSVLWSPGAGMQAGLGVTAGLTLTF